MGVFCVIGCTLWIWLVVGLLVSLWFGRMVAMWEGDRDEYR